MGRKSRAEERREAILAAFERCVIRYGIDAPLERIAEEAGVQRSLIRHYLGNRDEVVDQLIARIGVGYPQLAAAQFDEALARGAAGLLDLLFSPYPGATDWDQVINALGGTGPERYLDAKRRLTTMLDEIVADLARRLGERFPEATPEACLTVAYGLLYLAQGLEALRCFGLGPGQAAAARASAAALLSTLGHEKAAAP